MSITSYCQMRINGYDDKNDQYHLMNKILYEMVKEYPENLDENEIIAKSLIIGRSYSAALERGRNRGRAAENKTKVDEFYKNVAKRIKESDLDKKIKEIKKEYSRTGINDSAMKDVIGLHGYFVKKILTGEETTKLNKRSFASKYLHFHLPNLVFIYDSITSGKIGKYVSRWDKKIGVDFTQKEWEEWDETYAKFAYKAYEIYKGLKKINNINKYTSGDTLPRVVDNILLRD